MRNMKPKGEIASLTGLRGVAALLVVVAHDNRSAAKHPVGGRF
jgi:peptidoglycan/LPS O-acetylase OafA/YrhL